MFTKKELAAIAGVTPQTITRYEKSDAECTPSNQILQKLANALSYPISFFFKEDCDEALVDITSFRSLTSMTARVRDAALSAGSIGFELSDWIEDRFDLPPVSVPQTSNTGIEPYVAARQLREDWLLGERPIGNMIHLLESKGVRVFSLAENTLDVNAYSLWRDNKPYIFLNNMKSAECSRFDAAHELGHLVLHQEGKTKGKNAEEQANAFASAFLMPESDIRAHIHRAHGLQFLIQQKARWKVSLSALCYRLHKLNLLTDWTYRDLCITISKFKYNINEPNSIPREQSVVWNKLLTQLWSERLSHHDIAKELDLPVDEVESLIFGILPRDAIPEVRNGPGPYLRLLPE